MNKSDSDKRNPQWQRAEDCFLWELAPEFPPLYDKLESLFSESSEVSTSQTSMQKTSEYQKLEEDFKKIAFERILKQRFNDNFKEILRLLNETHGSTFTPKLTPLGSHFISDERYLELIILNIIAGAVVVYDTPENYKEDGKDADALYQQYPSERVQNLSKKLDQAIREEMLWVGDFSHSLWQLSHGEALETQLLSSEKAKDKLERLIKEVTLLSDRYLNMRTKGKGRFPTLAITEITKIVEHFPVPDARTISPIQRKYSKKDNETPLAAKIGDFLVSPDL
jgi:hypothetical protein